MSLHQEVEAVQNPALGAVLLWRFACGYAPDGQPSKRIPLPLFFIVLPLLFHEETQEIVAGTQSASGLHVFVDKFTKSSISKTDVLLGLQGRAVSLRALSMESFRIAVASRLLAVDVSDATVIPVTYTSPTSAVPSSIRSLLRSAERLGVWCAPHPLFEIAHLLKMEF